MSIRVNLQYTKALDLELIEKGIEVWIRRLTAQVRFKTKDGWTRSYEAIVDTGAPVSIIPSAVSEEISKNVLGDYAISGIVPHEEVVLPVKVAEVKCVLLDEKRISRTLKIKAYLSTDHRVPLVLGFENLLSKAILYSDYKGNKSFIEI
ncbi:MAG: hypothetical protein KAX15_04400 [Candidatus Omnitrophica bacterium]|nr:hypothetical protein [Candidatus Omnitrophota bacterium]